MNLHRRVMHIGIFIVCFSNGALSGQAAPNAMITVRVTDEAGQPLAGAEVGMGFELGTPSTPKIGLTPSSGFYTASAECSGYVTFGANKDNYYGTFYSTNFCTHAGGRWQPWNPVVDVVLKQIINPVPMYAKRVALVPIPAYDRPLGYDLIKGDWVAPHGGGTVSDFVFTASLRLKSGDDFDYCLALTFSNSGDGIQPFEAPYHVGSRLKSPREAPEQGYLPQWVQKRSRRPGQPEQGGPPDRKRNYFFRVRSRSEADGTVGRALYGKIYGDFMEFTYYLNPDGTRNMEFDPKRNLFKNLKTGEEPSRP